MDHSSIVNKLPPKSGTLLGVTNPFFEKSCAHWPHVLSLGRRVKHSNNSSAPTIIAGPAPGWKTKSHKRYISKDRALLKSLEDAVRGSDALKTEASLNLRRHFCSRTATFLVPLNRYLNTLIPTVAQQSAHASSTEVNKTLLRLKTFSTTDFFASLKAHGALLPFKSASKQKEFYERWLRTPAFGMWLGHQEELVHHSLKESAERGLAT
ncbi:hypothetical protein FIBSPDRAFT_1042594 [Athelia psychrophila]|uniref:UDENN domain-containing protein n=1 Tax=Athelia psychrophila TaxID=1759441 RepID=A0A166M7V9_9AGAM|nr:hypothetical protein FIBSPDRAFT_1042594 [Fibularhizoctonia sp. CBS 109695]